MFGVLDANSRDTILSTGGLSTSSRKEKRQYRKRKHKLREKHQHQQQQQQQPYSVHSSSPAPIESNIEDTEDEDILSGVHHITGTSGINGGSSEGEEEGLFAFKRKKNCEYLKVWVLNTFCSSFFIFFVCFFFSQKPPSLAIGLGSLRKIAELVIQNIGLL